MKEYRITIVLKGNTKNPIDLVKRYLEDVKKIEWRKSLVGLVLVKGEETLVKTLFGVVQCEPHIIQDKMISLLGDKQVIRAWAATED